MRNLSFFLCWMLISSAAVAAESRVERNIVYAVRGEKTLKADVYSPIGEGQFPAVLMVHGGAWMSGNKVHVTSYARRFARQGYVVVAINYRLAPRHKFPAQLEDCREALRWMGQKANEYSIDRERVGAFGYSAGGHLVCLLGMSMSQQDESSDEADDVESPRLKVIVAGGAPCEFRTLPSDNRRLAYWLGGSRKECPNAYRDASPVQFVNKSAPPVFFFHGERDRLVPQTSPRLLWQELKDLGVATDIYIIPTAGHMSAFLDASAAERAVEYVDQVLQPVVASGN